MLKNSFNRLFPTPTFLAMPSVGLDISDESLKFIELTQTKDGIKLVRFGEQKVPAGVIESGKIKSPQKMEEILSLFKKDYNVRSVRVSMPEEQTYLFKLFLPKQEVKNIRESIDLVLEEHIPVPATDVTFDFEVLSQDEKNLEIEVVATPSIFIEEYIALFEKSGIVVRSFELEGQAIARAVIQNGDMETYMIVDFGEKRTGIFIVSRGVVMFASTVDVGGVMLNSMIAKSFNVPITEAEKMKRKYGLERNVDNKDIFSVILNSVSILRDEIVKHSLYWNTHADDNGVPNPAIKKIILTGGGSNLIGLPEYFAVSMKTRVELGNAWINMADKEKFVPEISFRESLLYASAIGLALGDFEDK